MASALPSTMRGVLCRQTGVPLDEGVILKEDIRVPHPGRGEILCRVHCASVNPVDVKFCLGKEKLVVGITKSLPCVIGSDFCGTVVSLGEGCSRFKIGDAVIGDALLGTGSLAEYTCLPESMCSLKPKLLDDLSSCVLPLNSLTAYQGLIDHGEMKSGSKVLILGAAGNVGHLAVQIAKLKGAHVIGVTSSADRCAIVSKLGAHEVIDRSIADWSEKIPSHSVDIVLDTVGGSEMWNLSKKVLKSDGIFVTTAGDSHGDTSISAGIQSQAASLIRKFVSLFTGPSYEMFLKDAKKSAQLDEIVSMVDQGQLKPLVGKVYKLTEAVMMMKEVEKHHEIGKPVVAVMPQLLQTVM